MMFAALSLTASESSEWPQPNRSVPLAVGFLTTCWPGTPASLPSGKMYPIMSLSRPSKNRHGVCMYGSGHAGIAYCG